MQLFRRNIKDAFTRVAADPKTKLSRDNRFVGPALLCMKHHILPFYLAKGIAYGFLYRDESDIASIEITNYVKEHGHNIRKQKKFVKKEKNYEI